MVKSQLPDWFLSSCSRLKKTWLSLERDKLQIGFLNSCRDALVLPKHLMESIPKRQRCVTKFGDAHNSAIDKAISNRLESAASHKREFASKFNQLSVTDQKVCKIIIAHFVKREINDIVQKNADQLKSLSYARKSKIFQNNLEVKPVINLSHRKLSKSEHETLKYGFNMTWPNKINLDTAKVELENLYSKIEKLPGLSTNALDEIQTKLKCHYAKIDDKGNKSPPNKVINHIRNMHKLRKDESIYVSKFDKGNGICIDVKERYIYKMQQILGDTSKFKPYNEDKRVKKNSFIYAEEGFNRAVKGICKKFKIPKDIETEMTSTGSTPARLYGLPKVHKSEKDPPYRPVLSMVNAYPSKLAKYLDTLLKPYIPTTRTCKDSFQFKNDLLDASFPDSCHFVSYDVKSLFTNIPVRQTIAYILKTIPANEFPLPKAALRPLLTLSCSNILFSFQNNLYKQIEGMCMGSSLGPTMAAFALDMIEKKFNETPLFYRRYVDDVFAVFKNQLDAENFLDHINSFHPNLQFTIEHSEKNHLNFLDVSITRSNNKFHTDWYMKRTNTGVYLPKIAYSPMQYKTAAIRALIYRAYKLSSTEERFKQSYEKIKLIFINNGYHYKFIDKIKLRVIKSISNSKEKNKTEDMKTIYYKAPYIKDIEKENKITFSKINTILQEKAQIRIAYQTQKTSAFFPNKDRLTDSVRSKVVYKFSCVRCGGVYTGETIRHLSTRMEEHLQGRPTATEVTSHEHQPTAKQFTIALKTIHTKIGEALAYKQVEPHKRINANTPGYRLKLF